MHRDNSSANSSYKDSAKKMALWVLLGADFVVGTGDDTKDLRSFAKYEMFRKAEKELLRMPWPVSEEQCPTFDVPERLCCGTPYFRWFEQRIIFAQCCSGEGRAKLPVRILSCNALIYTQWQTFDF